MKGVARALHASACRRANPTPQDIGDYVDRAFSSLPHHTSSTPPPR
eukprot:SAG31_NODE_8031_length_1536_cov_7.522617_1_plen_45_part_10